MLKKLAPVFTTLAIVFGVVFSTQAAVDKGALLKGNQTVKGNNNLKGGGLISWNTYSSVDPTIFSHDLYSEKLTVLKSGHYFVSATLPIESAVGQRATQRALLKVNGNAGHQYALGQSSYARNSSGATEGSSHFNVLIWLKEGDVLTLDAQDIAGNANNRFLRTASLFVEKVEGNRNVFNAKATKIESGDNLNVSDEEEDRNLIWTGQRINKAFGFVKATPAAGITLKDAGNYLVYVNIPLEGSVGRGSVGLAVSLDDEIVEGARGQQGYIRNSNGHKFSSIHFSGVINATEGQVLKVETSQLAAAGTIKVQNGKTASIFIEKLADDGVFSDAFNTTSDEEIAENLNPNTKTSLALDGGMGASEPYLDDTHYANEGDAEEQIVIKKAGNYLLTLNAVFQGSSNRLNPRLSVEVNGQAVAGAESTAHYIRNSAGHNESSGSLVAMLNDLAVDDVVTVSVHREGGGGVVTAQEDGLVSLQYRGNYSSGDGDTSPPKLASFEGLGIDGFRAKVENFGLSIDEASIKATVDGADAVVTTSTEGGDTIVNYAFPGIPEPLSKHTVSLSYSDSAGNNYSKDLEFSITVDYKGVPASFASSSVDKSAPGFVANVTQISALQTEGPASIHGGNIQGAEKQLAGLFLNPNDLDDNDNPLPYLNEADPDAWDAWTIAPVEIDGTINWNQDEGAQQGSFGEETLIPQIPGWGESSDGIVAEILTYLDLKRGFHQFGVNSDDGFSLSFGPNAKDVLGVVAGQFNGNRGAADTIFNIVVPEAGLYPVRLVWWEAGGGANIEFFSVTDGKKILVNSDDPNAIKAYRAGASAPYISRAYPTGDVSKTIEFDIINGDDSVDKSSVVLKLNGEVINASVTSTDSGLSIVYDHGDYLPPGIHAIELSYKESNGTERVRDYSFKIPKGRIEVLASKPFWFFPFDETSGNIVASAIGNKNGDLFAGPELGVPALYPNGIGTAVRLDGSKDQAIRVTDDALLNTGGTWPKDEKSWEFWIKPESVSTEGPQVLWEQGGVTRGVNIYIQRSADNAEGETTLYMMAWNRAQTFFGGALNQVGDEGITAVSTTIKENAIYHIAFVMDGDTDGGTEGTLTGYLNGKQFGQVGGVSQLWAHADDSAFGNLFTNAVTHEGDQPGTGGQGFTGVIDDASFYNLALTEEQVIAHFEDGFAGAPDKIEITAQPQDTSASENKTATFTVDFTGMPVVDVKWMVNGEEVATDSVLTSSSVTITATADNNGAKIKAELTNKAGSVTTAEATLTTIIDSTAPEISSTSAYAGTLNTVTIVFNEPLDAASASNVANYKIDGLEVTAAALGDDGQTVTLSTSQQTAGNYSITVSGVKDLQANALNGSSSVSSVVDYAQEIISDGPIIYWKLAETEGNVATDTMGLRNGAYTGAPTLNVDSLVPASNDGAVQFNPDNADVIKIGDNPQMNTGTFKQKTLEFWFRADSLPKAESDVPYQKKMVLWEQGGGWKGLRFYLNATDDSDSPSKADLYFMANSHIGGGTTSDSSTWTAPPLDLRWGGSTDERGPDQSHYGYEDSVPVFVKGEIEVGKVYHVVGIVDGDSEGLNGKLLLYINGKLVDEVGGVGQMYSHGNDAGIGGINAGTIFHDEIADGTLLTDPYFFNGAIDEVAQYNLTLSADQVAGHYEVGNTASAPTIDGLLAAVPGLSSQAIDSLVAHYDGSIGVETDGNAVVSWTPVDSNGQLLNDLSVVSTQKGNGGANLITYNDGKLVFDDSSVGADGRYLAGKLNNAETTDFTVFWLGHYKADAPFATSGTYAYNIGLSNTSHQRDDGKGGFVVEQYNGKTYAGDDITKYDDQTTVWSTVLTADSHSFYANGKNLNLAGDPTNNVKPNADIVIGAYSSSGYDFVGEMEQLIIFNSALSDADRKLIENHLYGGTIPNDDPPAISVVRNADGTITVTFEGTLQSAPSVNGPWTDVDAPSPLTIPADAPETFGRAVRK